MYILSTFFLCVNIYTLYAIKQNIYIYIYIFIYKRYTFQTEHCSFVFFCFRCYFRAPLINSKWSISKLLMTATAFLLLYNCAPWSFLQNTSKFPNWYRKTFIGWGYHNMKLKLLPTLKFSRQAFVHSCGHTLTMCMSQHLEIPFQECDFLFGGWWFQSNNSWSFWLRKYSRNICRYLAVIFLFLFLSLMCFQ